jgi:hypothetical protein
MRTYNDNDLVQADHTTPLHQLARSEPWHADDEDTDRHLDPDDTDETIDAGGIRGIPRDALAQLLRFLLPVTTNQGRWKMAAVRLAVVCRILNIDDLGKLPLETLAKQIGVTRSLLSLRQLEIADGFNLGKLRSSKSAAARENYSAAATEAHARAGHRMAVEARQGASGTHMHKTTAISS